MMTAARVTVLMPTFRQETFIRRAIESLLAQRYPDWQLLVVDDGSPPQTEAAVAPYLANPRIHRERLPRNEGLGRALNIGLDLVTTDLIAYLPSDDLYHADHLASLVARLDRRPEAILAFSGVRHHYNRSATGRIAGEALQPVQVLHRRTPDR